MKPLSSSLANDGGEWNRSRGDGLIERERDVRLCRLMPGHNPLLLVVDGKPDLFEQRCQKRGIEVLLVGARGDVKIGRTHPRTTKPEQECLVSKLAGRRVGLTPDF